MNQQGAFIDVEADAAALDSMVGQGAIENSREGELLS